MLRKNIMVVSAGDEKTPPSIGIVTHYNDVLVKNSAGWRIKSRAGGPELPLLRQP